MPGLSLTLLGGFAAKGGDGEPVVIARRKAAALLAYLASKAGQHPRDKLAALLWPEAPDASARHSLRQALLTLRQALPRGAVRINELTVILAPEAVSVDVVAFERLATQGTPVALAQAATLYGGDFLAGFNVHEPPFEEWLQGERERLRELALEALARLLAAQRRANDLAAALQTALRLLALDPLQEVVHRSVMRLQSAQGRRDAALRQYQACVDILQRELGVEPEPETKQLYSEILRERARRSPVKDEPSREHHPVGASAQAPSFRSANTVDPIIGREADLARLGRALDEAGQTEGRVIAVLGEAGIGKSRLLAEFAARALGRGARVLLGQSYQSTSILPFGPWIDALRRGGAVAEVARTGLGAAWRRELGRLFPELDEGGRELATSPEDASRLFESIAQLLDHLAADGPVAVLLEDVHWADGMTVRLLASLARRLAKRPVLLVASLRDDELGDATTLQEVLRELDAERRLDRLVLTPLSRGETAELVRRLARTGTDRATIAPLADQLWAASHGHPFVVVETMAVLEQGAAAPTSGLPLPERVREIVRQRLDRLSDRARPLVAVAAVIGRQFQFPLFREAAALEEGVAAQALEELVRRRILRASGEHFDFTHDHIRQVAISELLPPRRTLLNRQVADALESLATDEADRDWSTLGAHYRDAHVWEKAVRYFRRAAEQASWQSANREAVACLEQALGALGHLPEKRETLELVVDLHLELRNALLPLADMERVGQCLRGAEDAAGRLDDPRRRAWVALYVRQYQWFTGDACDARTFAETSERAAEAIDDASLGITSTLYAGLGWYVAGEYRRAQRCQSRVLELLTSDTVGGRHGYQAFPLPAAHAHLTNALAELGEFRAGIEHGHEALRTAEALKDWYGMMLGVWALGNVYWMKGDHEEAIRLLERAAALVRDRRRASQVLGTLGHAYAVAGRVHDGLSLLEEARSALESAGVKLLESRLLEHLGEACLLSGRLEHALDFADQALHLARRRGERGYEAWTLRLQGEIRSRREPPELTRAEESYRLALGLAHRFDMRPLIAHCHLGLGRLYRRAERPEAEAHLRSAIAMYRDMDMRFWVGQARPEADSLR